MELQAIADSILNGQLAQAVQLIKDDGRSVFEVLQSLHFHGHVQEQQKIIKFLALTTDIRL